MTEWTTVLDGSGISTADVGGKAASLDRLLGIDTPVPPSGAITTAGYRRFVAVPELSGFLAQLRESPPAAVEDAESSTRAVDEVFLAASMPARLADEILTLAHQLAGGGQLAVRSSATAEDMASASFAGQYRSFLELEDDDDVLRAVRLTWASLWLPAPRTYRQFRGIPEDELAMAVVVMKLVDAEHAGVIFTADPGGDPDAVRIEAVAGLGEQLVSGDVTPDAYVVSRTPPRNPPGSAPAFLNELVDLALHVESRFGGPQDVEWAHDGDTLFLVQARPITTTPDELDDDDGFDTPPLGASAYTTAGVAEMLPGSLTPRVWTTAGAMLEEGFRQLFDGLDVLPDDLEGAFGVLGRFRGRTVLNLDMLKRAAAGMPGGSGEELERQYFGEVISAPDDEEPERKIPFSGIRSMARALRETGARRRFRIEGETLVKAAADVVDAEMGIDELSGCTLLTYRRRLRDLGARTVAAEVAVAAAAAAAYRGIELFLEPHLGDEDAGLLAQQLTAGGIRACGGQSTLQVCELVGAAFADPKVESILTSMTDWDQARPRLEDLAAGRQFLDAFDSALRRAGSAAVFGGETWRESPQLAWQTLRHAIDVEEIGRPAPPDREVVLADLEGRLRSTWKWKTTRIMTGQVVDMRRRLLRRLVADAVDFLDLRERTKAATLAIGGEMWRVDRRIGEILAATGALESPEDIDYLSQRELDEAVAGRAPTRAAVAMRRRIHDKALAEGPLPRLFTGRPDIEHVEVPEGDAFDGWAASPGVHQGRAVVVTDPATAEISRGDVLVAHTTDPSWTPLFLTAGAIIVEEGGPLSHAAIVARELSLPAVLNVPGIVGRLASGDHEVLVDGSSGAIVIVDSAPIADSEAEAHREVA